MAEKLYTIPINEVFDASAADAGCGCPFCALFNRLEDTEVDTILGASMMEEDIRMMLLYQKAVALVVEYAVEAPAAE